MVKERLQKVISRAGITSRRKAEGLIRGGHVMVNGRVTTELGAQADPQHDYIKVDGKRIQPEPLEYYALNKPRGVISSVSDRVRRPVVTQLISSRRRLYPAGRLDFHSEGLMILTNDGELMRKITQSPDLQKVYKVKVRGQPQADKLDRLRQGILSGGDRLRASRIRLLQKGQNSWYEVVLRQGKYRQIRRMFEQIGHPVRRIRRTAIGSITLGELPPGACRKLTSGEVQSLKGNRVRKAF